jgi:lysophospholipase L1-like esterase
VIAGDSLVKNMVGAYMSKDDVGHHYVWKAFPGATVEDMEDFIKPITRKSPNKVILHVGTNDLKNYTPKVIADSILNLTTQIKEDSPNTMVVVSAFLDRNDCPKLATKAKQVNLILDNYCQVNKIPFLKMQTTILVI